MGCYSTAFHCDPVSQHPVRRPSGANGGSSSTVETSYETMGIGCPVLVLAPEMLEEIQFNPVFLEIPMDFGWLSICSMLQPS